MLMRLCAMAIALVLVAVGLPVGAATADDNEVDLLLVLAADVSRSVDAEKFKLQREGYAAAITDPRVVKAMTQGSRRRIALCFVEWADDYEQSVIVSWSLIEGAEDAHRFARLIRTAPRVHSGRTSIGAGIDYALAQLGRAPFRSPRRVIDVSGDGTSNAERASSAEPRIRTGSEIPRRRSRIRLVICDTSRAVAWPAGRGSSRWRE